MKMTIAFVAGFAAATWLYDQAPKAAAILGFQGKTLEQSYKMLAASHMELAIDLGLCQKMLTDHPDDSIHRLRF